MAMLHEDELDELKQKKICYHCIGEAYLKNKIKKEGKRSTCSYCQRHAKSYNLEYLAEVIEGAFERHYYRTSDQPNSWQQMLLSDKESDYGGRDGELVVDAIMNACDMPEQAAHDVQRILEAQNFDFDSAAMGDETDFSSDSYYEEKGTDDSFWWEEWRRFEKSLQTEARFFSRSASALLESVFDGIDNIKTHDGRLMLAHAGPDTDLSALYRARVFQSCDNLEESLAYPDTHIGPPPSQYAHAGRMNAHGISVFYGASDPQTALAEVRPPVGSQVVIARFDIIRPLRLLDLTALSAASESGSIFDPTFIDRLVRAIFLRNLSRRITVPVMPDDEALKYLATQAIADFLATESKLSLDGIIYPSVQVAGGRLNIVLFHKAARVEKINLPNGSKVQTNLGHWDDEGEWEYDYTVFEETPEDAETESKEAKHDLDDLLSKYSPPDGDSRVYALRVDVDSINIHIVESVEFTASTHQVHRHRYKKSPSTF